MWEERRVRILFVNIECNVPRVRDMNCRLSSRSPVLVSWITDGRYGIKKVSILENHSMLNAQSFKRRLYIWILYPANLVRYLFEVQEEPRQRIVIIVFFG